MRGWLAVHAKLNPHQSITTSITTLPCCAAGDWKRMPQFSRLLLFHALRPDRLTAAMSKFVSDTLGAALGGGRAGLTSAAKVLKPLERAADGPLHPARTHTRPPPPQQ